MTNEVENTIKAEDISWDNLPKDVQTDMDNGFVMTDIDDCLQRCKKISETVFLYRAGTEALNDIDEEEIDVTRFTDEQKEKFVSSYYGSMRALTELMEGDEESINMMVAECYFEEEVTYSRERY